MRDTPKKRVIETLQNELAAIKKLRSSLNTSFFKAVQELQRRKGRIIVTGIGKSAHIGMKIVATFVSLGHPANFLHPVEALHGDTGVVSDGDIVIALSFSGESPEIIKIIRYLKNNFRLNIIAITGHATSSLSRVADYTIRIYVTNEGSPHNLAPMASTTAMLVVGDLLASAVTSPEKFEKSHFAKFHPGGSLGLKLKLAKDFMKVGKKIPITQEFTLFTRALLEINRKKQGTTGVIGKNGKLIGVITDGDIRRFLISGGDSKKAQTRDVMTRNPKTILAEESLEKALLKMEQYKITNLFVVDKKSKPVGIIHIHDILEENLAP